jgi:hypothetical protein
MLRYWSHGSPLAFVVEISPMFGGPWDGFCMEKGPLMLPKKLQCSILLDWPFWKRIPAYWEKAIMVLLRTGEELRQYTPPPLRRSAEFPTNVQFMKVSDELEQYTPPPVPAELSLRIQLVKLAEEFAQYTPPPPDAQLSLSLQFVRVGEEE